MIHPKSSPPRAWTIFAFYLSITDFQKWRQKNAPCLLAFTAPGANGSSRPMPTAPCRLPGSPAWRLIWRLILALSLDFHNLHRAHFSVNYRLMIFSPLWPRLLALSGWAFPWLLRDKISPIAKVFLKKLAVSTTSHTARLATMCYYSNCYAMHGMDTSLLPMIPAHLQPPIAPKRHHRSGSSASDGHPMPHINCVSIPFFFRILQ